MIESKNPLVVHRSFKVLSVLQEKELYGSCEEDFQYPIDCTKIFTMTGITKGPCSASGAFYFDVFCSNDPLRLAFTKKDDAIFVREELTKAMGHEPGFVTTNGNF